MFIALNLIARRDERNCPRCGTISQVKARAVSNEWQWRSGVFFGAFKGCERLFRRRRRVRCQMNKNRKTSPELQKQVNPGPAKDAKVTDIQNPSGRPNMSIPSGRGGTSNDHSATEKQNQ